MSKYKIEFSSQARKDLNAIIKYIKFNLKEPSIALKFYKKIRSAIDDISKNPNVFPIIVDEIIRPLKFRKFIVNNYIIFFKVIEEQNLIQIVRIMYARRNWIKILQQK